MKGWDTGEGGKHESLHPLVLSLVCSFGRTWDSLSMGLLPINPQWRLPKCPWVEGWIHRLWFTQTRRKHKQWKRIIFASLNSEAFLNMLIGKKKKKEPDTKEYILYYQIYIKCNAVKLVYRLKEARNCWKELVQGIWRAMSLSAWWVHSCALFVTVFKVKHLWYLYFPLHRIYFNKTCKWRTWLDLKTASVPPWISWIN